MEWSVHYLPMLHSTELKLSINQKERKQNRYSVSKLIEKSFPNVPYSENRFVCVKGDKSPYDGDLSYWSLRNSKLYDGHTSSALKRQNHSCVACGHKFTSEEKVHYKVFLRSLNYYYLGYRKLVVTFVPQHT